MPEIPDVPSIFDYAKTTEQRQLMRFIFSSTEFGRPYVVPARRAAGPRGDHAQGVRRRGPGSGADRRGGPDQARHDLSAAGHLERLVAKLYETPPALIETVKKLVPNLQ